MEKNLLIYGENGAGKSSLYDVFRWIFQRKELFYRAPGTTQEDIEQHKNDVRESFRCKKLDTPFSIQVDNKDYKDFIISNYQAFLLCKIPLANIQELKIHKFLESNNFPSDVIARSTADWQNLESEINTELKDKFHEPIEIKLNQINSNGDNDYLVSVKDSSRKLDYSKDLPFYFNESKLYLVQLLILFNVIKEYSDSTKERIIVMDDLFTSMDAANRVILINYIIEEFRQYQKVVFTHITSFFNLFSFIGNIKDKENWNNLNIYETSDKHKIQPKVMKLTDMCNALSTGSKTPDEIGNEIRQYFENQLHRLSLLYMIGAREETKKIIENIETGKKLYFFKDCDSQGHPLSSKNIYDLIDLIEHKVNANRTDAPCQSIRSEIAKYRYVHTTQLQDIVKNLHIYQKVAMHPLSHATSGIHSYTKKEVYESLILLERLDKLIKEMGNLKDVTSF